MASRSGARRAALEVLFAADATGVAATSVLEERLTGSPDDPASADTEFTRELVTGVADHRERIDELLGQFAKDWSVPRMPAVDRSILRLACEELLFRKDVPIAVAIDEAVKAAKELSTDESAAFVNGVLGALVRAELQDQKNRSSD